MNKLREKLMPYASGFIGSSMLTNTEFPEQIDKNTNELEQITDDFAIKFSEWCDNTTTQVSKGEWANWLPNCKHTLSTSELLQIFKEKYYETNN